MSPPIERRTGLTRQEVEEIVVKTTKETVKETMKEMFALFGIDISQPFELQQDMQHLRGWRKSTQRLKNEGLMIAFKFVIWAALGLMVAGLGIKYFSDKG